MSLRHIVRNIILLSHFIRAIAITYYADIIPNYNIRKIVYRKTISFKNQTYLTVLLMIYTIVIAISSNIFTELLRIVNKLLASLVPVPAKPTRYNAALVIENRIDFSAILYWNHHISIASHTMKRNTFHYSYCLSLTGNILELAKFKAGQRKETPTNKHKRLTSEQTFNFKCTFSNKHKNFPMFRLETEKY